MKKVIKVGLALILGLCFMAEQVNAMTTKDMVGKVYNVDVKVTYDENNDRVQAVKRTGIIHSGPSNGSYVLLTGKSGKSA